MVSKVKRQIQADSFLVELIFILLSHISQGDSLLTCELDYMLLFYLYILAFATISQNKL